MANPHTQLRFFVVGVSVYCAGWGLYYAVQDGLRRSHIRKRRRRHPLRAPPADAELAALTLELAGSGSQAVGPSKWFGSATAEEFGEVSQRWSSLSILGRYVNVCPEWREQGIWEYIVWKGVDLLWYGRIWWDGGYTRDTKTEQGRRRIEEKLPVRDLDRALLWGKEGTSLAGAAPAAAKENSVSCTWIGQSTCLLQLAGLNILTDPVFGKQPVPSVFSPTRMRPMPCGIDELVSGRIDVIVVSHDHFDHLDLTIIPLVPSTVYWVIPLGLAALLRRSGVTPDRITELDWWRTTSLSFPSHAVRAADETVQESSRSLAITAVPAMHWSGRSPANVCTSLWCSYAMRVSEGAASSPLATCFFSCDTGYSHTLYKAIGYTLGPFDLAIVPIGSYAPRWHMKSQHTDPQGAVGIARDIGARTALGVHWGTWSMSSEPWYEPLDELASALTQAGLPSDFVRTIAFGQTVVLR